MDSSIGGRKGSARPELDRPSSADTHEEGLRMGQSRGSKRKSTDGSTGVSNETSVRVPDNVLGDGRGTEREPDGGIHNANTGADRTGAELTQREGQGNNTNPEGRVLESGGNGRSDTKLHADGASRILKSKPAQKRSLSTEKVGYAPKSENPFTLQLVMPADQQEAVKSTLWIVNLKIQNRNMDSTENQTSTKSKVLLEPKQPKEMTQEEWVEFQKGIVCEYPAEKGYSQITIKRHSLWQLLKEQKNIFRKIQ